jgi:hypothetical protein
MLKVSVSKIFSILAVLLFFSRIAFSQEGTRDRWESYFPPQIQEKAVQALKRDAGVKASHLGFQFSVEGRQLKPASTVEDLIQRMNEFQQRIARSEKESVAVMIDGRNFEIDRVALGEGLTGIAYEIRGESSVLKLPQAHAIAFKAMMKEAETVNQQGTLERAGLAVAKSLAVHPFGLYAVKEKAPERNLTEYLIQQKLIEVSGEDAPVVRRISETQLALALRNPSLHLLAGRVEEMLRARRHFEKLRLDLGPDNLHLVTRAGEVQKLVLVDLGASSESTKNLIDGLQTFSDYLTFSEKIIGRYVQSGAYATRAAHVAHRNAKCQTAFGL